MKNILILIILLLTSCGSKHKLVEESKVEKTEKVDSVATVVKAEEKEESLLNEEIEYSYQNDDTTSTAPLEIIKKDGTKIVIPKGGHLKASKYQANKTYNTTQKSSTGVKRNTEVTQEDFSKEKNVERNGIPTWIFIALAAFIIYIIYDELKTKRTLGD